MQELDQEQNQPVTYVKQFPLELFTPESQPIAKQFICCLCKGVSVQISFDICGHFFCNNCLTKHFEVSNLCPKTKCEVSAKTISYSMGISEVINGLRLFCRNRSKGCNWEGYSKDFINHIENGCPKEPIKCTNEGCDCKVIREDSQAHYEVCEYRVVLCQQCNTEMKAKQLPAHLEVCPKYLVECPNACGTKLVREMLQKHIENECVNVEILCPYRKYCHSEKPFLRKELDKHLSSNNHLNYLFSELDRIKAILKNKNIITNEDKEGDIFCIKSEPVRVTANVPTMLHHKKKKEPIEQKTSVHSSKSSKHDNKIRRKMKRRKENINEEDSSFNKSDNISLDSDKNSEEKLPLIEEVTTSQKEVTKPHHPLKFSEIFKLNSDFKVTKNSVKILSKKKESHVLIVGNVEFGSEKRKYSEFQVLCIHKPGKQWIGVGLCDPAIVQQNDYTFYKKEGDNFLSGVFGVSTNGYTWNSNNKLENDQSRFNVQVVRNKISMVTVTFKYSQKDQTLTYSVNDKFKGQLTKVKPLQSDCLTLFIAFLNEGDEVQFNYIK